MPRLIHPLILISALCLLRCTPVNDPHEEAPKIYRAAIDRIIHKYFLARHVPDPYPGFFEKKYEEYLSGKIDSTRYEQICDSLFTIRKAQLPKCAMEYSPLFSDYQSESDLQCSITLTLHDPFFYDHFRNTRIYPVLDTLTRNTTYNWKDIAPSYMDFTKHDTSDHQHPYGKNNNGVLALSSIYLNQTADHAIVFFEFKGGHQYQRGELIFLEKKRGTWAAVAFRTLWIT